VSKIKRKNKLRLLLISCIVISVSLLLVLNNIIISTRIYFKINYHSNLSNSDEIIEKVESFDYVSYLKLHEYDGEIYNLSRFSFQYIDSEYLDYLNQFINRELSSFHLWPFYYNYITYTFNATEVSKLYLTYNNDTIFETTYENNDTIFEADKFNGYWMGSWYINFTQIPYVPISQSTIILNDSFLVQMTLSHRFDITLGESGWITLNQFLILDSNLQIIIVYIPLRDAIIA